MPLGSSTSTISSFKNMEIRHDVYRGKDCMKKFCESLREQAMKIINFKKKKMKFLNLESKISAPTWNKGFELPDGSYPVSDIQ